MPSPLARVTSLAGRRPVRGPLYGWLLAGAWLLAGCGFHLQGSAPLPEGVERMSVSYHNDYTVGDPALVTAIEQRLRRQNLLGGAGASAELEIVRVDQNRRVIAVSPVDGDAAVFLMTVRVVFNYSVRGAEQLRGEVLSTSREYAADATQGLSAEDERGRVLEQMQSDLASLVLERISLYNRQTTPEDTASPEAG